MQKLKEQLAIAPRASSSPRRSPFFFECHIDGLLLVHCGAGPTRYITEVLAVDMEAPGPSTTSTVSASGVEAIETTIEVTPQAQISEIPLEEVYEVDRTIAEIQRGGWTKVCLLCQISKGRMPTDVKLFAYIDLHAIS